MFVVTYRITLNEPLLATGLNGDPNSSVSLPYVPGSMVRGMLIAQYGIAADLAIAERELFFNGQVCYLNAYPAHPYKTEDKIEEQRSLPIPASWRKEKTRISKAGIIEDWALLAEAESELNDGVAVSGEFVWLGEEGAIIKTPPTHISIHTQRAREAGRATQNGGAIYRYEALAAGEQFAGVILCANQPLADQVKQLLSAGTTYLGGSQTAGYGQVQIDNIDNVEVADDEGSDDAWCEYNGELTEIAAGDKLVITLVSDTILVDENGATHTDLLAALQLPLQQTTAFKQVATVGGFNRKWGFPLPKASALRAGSVFVCEATNAITKKKLTDWLKQGVGERRVEGFGRLAFNWQTAEKVIQQESFKPHTKPNTLELSSDEQDPARQMAQRMVRRRQRQMLDQALIKAVRKLKIENAPPNSQLSGIRIIARDALQEGKLARVSNLFKDRIDGRDNPDAIKLPARTKFERARLDHGKRLHDWIMQLTDNPTTVWHKLGKPDKTLGSITAQHELAAEYAIRLIDAVLAQAINERRKSEGKQGGDVNGAA